MVPPTEDSVLGCLLGTAVGDSVGLRYEGLSKRRQHRMYPRITGPAFVFGRGMVSDDTEHTCMVAQALIASAGHADTFTQNLAKQFRLWLLGVPPGIGYATLRAILRLWLGYSPDRSGVFSAGNGPAMRSAILGVCYGSDPERLRALVNASTRLTHTDPKVAYGALAVAVAAYLAAWEPAEDVAPYDYLQALRALLPREADALIQLVEKAVESAASGQRTAAFAEALGLHNGVSGYVYHTVPVALHAWFTHQDDYRQGIVDIVRCGGDTDTTAAILGGIIGARVGKHGIPADWLGRLRDWPRTVAWIEQLGRRLLAVASQSRARETLPVSLPGTMLRNALFLLVVLGYGLRRLLPPY